MIGFFSYIASISSGLYACICWVQIYPIFKTSTVEVIILFHLDGCLGCLSIHVIFHGYQIGSKHLFTVHWWTIFFLIWNIELDVIYSGFNTDRQMLSGIYGHWRLVFGNPASQKMTLWHENVILRRSIDYEPYTYPYKSEHYFWTYLKLRKNEYEM